MKDYRQIIRDCISAWYGDLPEHRWPKPEELATLEQILIKQLKPVVLKIGVKPPKPIGTKFGEDWED